MQPPRLLVGAISLRTYAPTRTEPTLKLFMSGYIKIRDFHAKSANQSTTARETQSLSNGSSTCSLLSCDGLVGVLLSLLWWSCNRGDFATRLPISFNLSPSRLWIEKAVSTYGFLASVLYPFLKHSTTWNSCCISLASSFWYDGAR